MIVNRKSSVAICANYVLRDNDDLLLPDALKISNSRWWGEVAGFWIMEPRFLGNGNVSHAQLPSRISLCAFKRSCETLRRNLEALVYAESLVIALLAQARNSQLRGHCSPNVRQRIRNFVLVKIAAASTLTVIDVIVPRNFPNRRKCLNKLKIEVQGKELYSSR